MGRVDEYLEKKGTKHLMALVTVLYIIGTVIFNVYLRSLGIFEFELIQLRYVFVGLVFSLITAIIVGILSPLYFGLKKPKEPEQKRRTKKKKAQQENSFVEMIFFVCLIPWIITYALHVFPEIPSGFGGAKPITARLIGEAETIKKINSLIAHETGVAENKLPFEMVSEDTNLAIGANVKILDRNRDRILLILTKDLYLSSTSKLAKSLIEAGTSSDKIETEETKNFTQKSLLVKADKIESITFSLYEPPEILTKQDLEIASQVLSEEEMYEEEITVASKEKKDEEKKKNTAIVEQFIVQQVPDAAPQIIEAVKKAPKVIATAPPKTVTEHAQDEETEEDSTREEDLIEITAEVTNQEPEEDTIQEDQEVPAGDSLESVLNQFIDTKFIDYRAEFYKKASELYERERFAPDLLLHERFLLAKKITQTFRREYPEAWMELTDINYLATGQSEERFLWKLMEAFRGAESVIVLIDRINAMELDQKEIKRQEKIKAIIEAQQEQEASLEEGAPESSTVEPETEESLSTVPGEEPSIESTTEENAPETIEESVGEEINPKEPEPDSAPEEELVPNETGTIPLPEEEVLIEPTEESITEDLSEEGQEEPVVTPEGNTEEAGEPIPAE